MTEPFRVRLTGSSAGTLDQVIVQIELVDRAKKLCPAPWALFDPSSLSGVADGSVVTYYEDTSGNGRHLEPVETGEVKVRTVAGEKLLYREDAFITSKNELSVAWNGGPIDWDGTPPTTTVPGFTIWCEVVDPRVGTDTWLGLPPFSGGASQLQVGTGGFPAGEVYAFEKTFGNLFGPVMPSGKSRVVVRFDVGRQEAELWLNGTLADTEDDLDPAGFAWGLSVAGAFSSTGGLGKMILWDQWIEDECLPGGSP